jgi:hypothetical protein
MTHFLPDDSDANPNYRPADQRAAERLRLAQLIAELLAKDWLRSQCDALDEQRTTSSRVGADRDRIDKGVSYQ